MCAGISQKRTTRVVKVVFPMVMQYYTITQISTIGYEFGGSGSCKGDSGGPLMRYTYEDGPSSAKFVQQGIVQGGVGTCGSKDFPSIYVRLRDPEVLEFIQLSLAGNKLLLALFISYVH